MPIELDISPLDRLVVIAAIGPVSAEDIRQTAQKVVAADVLRYSKIIDVSMATSDLTRAQIEEFAAMVRGGTASAQRGPLAFVINPERVGFAHAFAEMTEGERPVKLFRSLHEARKWLRQYPAVEAR